MADPRARGAIAKALNKKDGRIDILSFFSQSHPRISRSSREERSGEVRTARVSLEMTKLSRAGAGIDESKHRGLASREDVNDSSSSGDAQASPLSVGTALAWRTIEGKRGRDPRRPRATHGFVAERASSREAKHGGVDDIRARGTPAN